ncbi:bifunctional serine/threonine-protein kinase/ABC transporter substrate-binding protein [Nostoc linckia]|uniref:bifunctional serine/threonine-protein kinase/ABC transporter substrate-binding protein n=1 Tax=Nostoc linckia TaxID=92942 RepID=UPI0015D4F768|nr:bifunctional serine/threonine-protein kinase/ABC transporter substrate-binding protein [Nostoc linckia]
MPNINPRVQRYCEWCRTPLILQNRYLPLDEIGSGGFGKTFRTYDFNLDQDCAIKILRPVERLTLPKLESVIQGFKQGAKILNNLSHPEIPKVYDYFDLEVSEQQKFFYLVQTYIPGQTLAQELATSRRFSELRVVEILRSLLQIICYTHSQNVIHRDIKPSNIIRHISNHKLYLIDFDGAIKRELEPGVPVNQSRAMGTVGYAPPEQLCGRDIDISADLYAIAATCVYLLTRKEPAQICNTNNLLYQSWRIYIPNVEENLARILDKMLSPYPNQRYQSPKEVIEALSAISTPSDPITFPDPSSSLPPPPKPQPTRPPERPILERVRRILRPWSWVSFGFLALLAVAIAFILHSIFTGVLNDNQTGVTNVNQTETPPMTLSDEYFSRGENALITQRKETLDFPKCTNAYNLKRKGIDVFKQASSSGLPADFKQAEDYFKQALDQFKEAFDDRPNNKCEVDPETSIYYYNSKAAQTASARTLPTIAVVISSLETERGNNLEILRGVAQVLKEQTQGAPVVQILIAKNNSDDINEIQQVAKQLSEKKITGELSYFNGSEILGVISRYTSKYIWEVGDIYGQKEVVLIAPTSTAIRTPNLYSDKPNLNPYVFRTASDDSIAAGDLADYMWESGKRKVMIVFESEDPYSESLKGEFEKKLIEDKGANQQDFLDCDLRRLKPRTCIQLVRNQKVPVQALMLAPSPRTKTPALEIIQLNDNLGTQKLQVLAGDVLYSDNLGNYADGMVVAVFSHHSLANDTFKKKALDIWKTAEVSWRTLSSYDAAKAFIQALTKLQFQKNNNPNRQKLYKELQSISALGATTVKVEFDNKHDRKALTGVGILVQAQYDPKSGKCKLTYLETPKRNNQLTENL